ncbi:hypothetical protein L1887_30136 [Cichorium endivia]|nr:hypothetical protein L1887_30136 [Cichorium endivia]
MKKPERKVAEKIRRNQMKFLYSRLFSLIPPHFIKGSDQVSDRVDRAIEYIQSLKSSVEMSENRKEQLLSSMKKRSRENTTSDKSIDIQIHEMSPDLDVVLITGLKTNSEFYDVVRLLNQYSSEIALANFSSCGHSTFHVRHKQIGAGEMSHRLRILLEGSSNIKELGEDIALSLDQLDSNLSVWDFDFQSNVWGWELEALPMTITS